MYNWTFYRNLLFTNYNHTVYFHQLYLIKITYLMFLTLELSPNSSQFVVKFGNHATSMYFPISWILPKFPRDPRHLRTNYRHIENFQYNHKDSFPSTRYWIEPPVYSLYIPYIHFRLEVMGSFKKTFNRFNKIQNFLSSKFQIYFFQNSIF